MKIREYLKKIGFFGSMRGRLALYLMLLAIVPFILIVVITLQSEKSALSGRIRSHLTIIADIQKNRIITWLSERGSEPKFLARDKHIIQNLEYLKRVGDPAKYRGSAPYNAVLDELESIRANHGYVEMLVLDEKGRVVVSTRQDDLGESRADEGYFQGALKSGSGSSYIQDIYFDKTVGKIAMAFSAPIKAYKEQGNIGVVSVIVDMDKSFYPFFEVWPGMGKTGDTLIARMEKGQVVFLNRLRYRHDAPLKFKIPVDENTPTAIMFATEGREGIVEAKDYRGVMVLAAYRYIPETKWGMVVKEDYSEAFSAIHRLTREALLLMVLTIAFVFVLIYFVTAKITAPIVSLDRLARKIAQGDFSVSLPVKKEDEVGRLAGSFNEMAKALMKYRKEVDEKNKALEGANRELVSLAESLEEKVKNRTQELEELNRALISMMEDLDERTAALESSQVELRKFAKDLEESRNRVRENLEIVERANVELRRIDRMKDQFLGMMSHEVRTPLSLITGYSSSLLTDISMKLDPKVEEGLEGILKGAERLKNIVTEMLDISQIDAKGLRLAFAPTDMGRLVDEVLKELDSFIKERKHEIIKGDFSKVPEIYMDKRRMRQVLVNIMGNSIKFTPDNGRIEITYTLYPPGSDFVKELERPEAEYIDLTVKDSGIGIDREEAERIFEKFYEVGEIDKHATSKYRFLGRGVGLGLPIARGIVEAHGGKLWVESPGYDTERCPGSVFHVLLPVGLEVKERAAPAGYAEEAARVHAQPVRPVVKRTAAETPAPSVSGRPKVLVIEDDPDILNLTALVLRKDYEIHKALDGSEGLKMAREIHPALVLLDVYMEGINGYEVCETLKHDENTKDIPVAMFTAGVQRWEIERGYKAGADDYITKPFKPEELLAKVRDLISGVCETAKDRVD